MNNITGWLLDDEAPEIKYRTMLELLDKPRDDASVTEAHHALINSQAVLAAMDKFKANKKWEDFQAFSILAEFGLTRADVPIDEYVERLITSTNFNMMCGRALLLRNLVALGYDEDTRVKEQIDMAFSLMRGDGTFRCLSKTKKMNDSNLADMGCYRQTTTYLLLAAELKKKGHCLPQFESLVNFYLAHQIIFHTDKQDELIIPEMTETFYPFDPVKMGLSMVLYGIAVLGAINDPACEKAFALLESKKDEGGRYILEKTFSKPHFNVGKAGKPNKWVTLYALLIHKYKRFTLK